MTLTLDWIKVGILSKPIDFHFSALLNILKDNSQDPHYKVFAKPASLFCIAQEWKYSDERLISKNE